MAIITINKRKFEREIGRFDDKMKHNIAMFGTPLEKEDKEEIQVEVSPNRPDFLSYGGFKRSFLAFLDKKTGLKKYKIEKPNKDYVVNVDSSVYDVRPYTACAIVKGLKLDSEKIKELVDTQEKLHFTVGRKRKKVAIGIYPLEKIKLPITYKALEPDKIIFIPLDEKKKMSGLEILQKHPAGKKYSHLLSGKTKFPVFLDSEKNILSMPPIINSEFTGRVDEKTKNVFVECSGFNLPILKKCLNLLVTSLAEMGGKIYQMEVKNKKKEITPNLSPEEKKISLKNTNNLLGLNLNEKQLKKSLEKMGHDYSNGIVKIPPWRTDILHEVDLIEDVAIAYGYDNLIPEIPEVSTVGQEDPKESIKRKISEILSGVQMLETSSYHLTTRNDQFSKMDVKEKKETDYLFVEESKTDYNVLRKSLTPLMLKIFSENVDSEYPQKIFEMGKVFSFSTHVNENEHLAGAISPSNFTEIKQIIEYLFKMLNININIVEPEDFPKYFINGRVAEIFLDKKSIGFIGEIHPKILKNWKLRMSVGLFEINLEEIFQKLLSNLNIESN